MKYLIVIAFLAVASAQEYHDDVFHFSSLKGLNNLKSSLQQTQSRPVYTQQVVQQVRPVQVVRQQVVQTRPVYTQQVVRTSPIITQQVVRTTPVITQQVVRTTPVITQVVRAQPQVHTVVEAVPAPQYSQISSQYNQGGTVKYIRILEHVQEATPSGPYRIKFSTENGITSSEQGDLTAKNPTGGAALAKQGTYSYTGEDGQQYAVNWIADEYGFRASGAHLPTPPPIPAEIQRSLDLIASQPRIDLRGDEDDSKK